MSDYYSILGLQKNADQDEIKKAYRRMAAQHHPDRGGDTQKFQEIQAAYETLSDPEKKAQYDNPQPQMGGFHFHTSGFPPGFEHIFAAMGGDPFNGFFNRRQPQNRSLNIQTSITLEDAFFGKELIANLKLPSGKEQLLEVRIPPGIQDGQTLRLSGMGDDTHTNLPRGDLHITITVQPHHEFIRQGDDLIKKMDINCLEAIVGKKINVKTIDNKLLEININPGTQHGQILSIHGHGMPNMSNPLMRGRLLLNVNITIPTNLSDTQLNTIKQIIC
jgi:curved DNA-binding protein